MFLSQRYEKKFSFSSTISFAVSVVIWTYSVSHWLTCLNTWSLAVQSTGWEDSGTFRRKALLEEVGHSVCGGGGVGVGGGWDCPLMFYSPASLPVLTSCEELIGGFLTCRHELSCCMSPPPPPGWTLSLETVSQNKLFLLPDIWLWQQEK